MASNIQIKRVYEKASVNDGKRVLIDRLWPRGMSKEKARIDVWLKDASPTPKLRKWFDHRPERFETFAAEYKKELKTCKVQIEALEKLLRWSESGRLTLLYAAKDPIHNHAVVLLETLQEVKGNHTGIE